MKIMLVLIVALLRAACHEILQKALNFAPGLQDSTVLETRVGFRPFTPGFLPVVGSVPGYAGILISNGLGSSGLTMGPIFGQNSKTSPWLGFGNRFGELRGF